MSKSHTLEEIHRRISPSTDTPSLDAQLLLSEVTGKPRSHILAHPDLDLNPDQIITLERMVKEVQQDIPLPYVIGHWEFFKLDFTVNQNVLIPRPETELLVETALNWLSAHPAQRWAADVGTGSGCIGISLAHHIPDLNVLGVDLSHPALTTAAENASRHRVSRRLHLLQADLLTPVNHRFGLITANLPYVPTGKLRTLPVYGREPTLALNGGPDGQDTIRRLLAQAGALLNPGGLMLLEVDEDTARKSHALARQALPGAQVTLKQDLAGQDRYLIINRVGDPL